VKRSAQASLIRLAESGCPALDDEGRRDRGRCRRSARAAPSRVARKRITPCSASFGSVDQQRHAVHTGVRGLQQGARSGHPQRSVSEHRRHPLATKQERSSTITTIPDVSSRRSFTSGWRSHATARASLSTPPGTWASCIACAPEPGPGDSEEGRTITSSTVDVAGALASSRPSGSHGHACCGAFMGARGRGRSAVRPVIAAMVAVSRRESR
jgi:hypothetical protein